MGRVCSYFKSTIGQKVLVAFTGLGFTGFCIAHMSGNLLLLNGAESYNKYSHSLITNPFLYAIEIVLLGIFITHFSLALFLAVKNRMKKGVKTQASAKNKGSSFAAKTMAYSGSLLLVFLILHLKTFKFGTHYSVTYDGIEMRDLYRLVLERFKEPGYLAFYVFCMTVLGIHLSHGLKGAVQSLGFMSSADRQLKKIGWAVTLVIAVGFSIQPLYLFFFGV